MFTRKRMRFNMQIIWQSLFWYFKFTLSMRDIVLMLKDRGVEVSHVSIFNWITKFTPELEKQFRKYKLPVNHSWRIDETYIKIKGKDRYLYRAVDKLGNTIDFLLTFRREKGAAERFFNKSIQNHGIPAKANVDKSGANMAALDFVNESNRNRIEVRQQKYLNNIVEQDHRFIKKKTKSLLGFKAFYSAKNILAGVEILHMIFKNQSGYMPLFNQDPQNAYWSLVHAIKN